MEESFNTQLEELQDQLKSCKNELNKEKDRSEKVQASLSQR